VTWPCRRTRPSVTRHALYALHVTCRGSAQPAIGAEPARYGAAVRQHPLAERSRRRARGGVHGTGLVRRGHAPRRSHRSRIAVAVRDLREALHLRLLSHVGLVTPEHAARRRRAVCARADQTDRSAASSARPFDPWARCGGSRSSVDGSSATGTDGAVALRARCALRRRRTRCQCNTTHRPTPGTPRHWRPRRAGPRGRAGCGSSGSCPRRASPSRSAPGAPS
jgi:hypothetical protein